MVSLIKLYAKFFKLCVRVYIVTYNTPLEWSPKGAHQPLLMG